MSAEREREGFVRRSRIWKIFHPDVKKKKTQTKDIYRNKCKSRRDKLKIVIDKGEETNGRWVKEENKNERYFFKMCKGRKQKWKIFLEDV